MSCWAILPVRGLQGGKQRLAGEFDAGQRETLCRALLEDALDALKGSHGLDGILVVTSDAAVTAIAQQAGVTVLPETAQGLNAAVAEAVAWARDQRISTVLVMHADLPFVHAAAIDRLLQHHQREQGPHCTLVPDRHGQGTNALVLTPPGSMPFAYGEDSLNQHLMLAVRQGLHCSVMPDEALGCDIDTPEDLVYVRSQPMSPVFVRGGRALALLGRPA